MKRWLCVLWGLAVVGLVLGVDPVQAGEVTVRVDGATWVQVGGPGGYWQFDRVRVVRTQGVDWLRIAAQGAPRGFAWEAGDQVFYDKPPEVFDVAICPKSPPPGPGMSWRVVTKLWIYAWGSGEVVLRYDELPPSPSYPVEGSYIRNSDGSMGGYGRIDVSPKGVQAGATVFLTVTLPARMIEHVGRVELVLPDPNPLASQAQNRTRIDLPFSASGIYTYVWTVPFDYYGGATMFQASAAISYVAWGNKLDMSGRIPVITRGATNLDVAGVLALEMGLQGQKVDPGDTVEWDENKNKERLVWVRAIRGKGPFSFTWIIDGEEFRGTPHPLNFRQSNFKNANALASAGEILIRITDANGNEAVGSFTAVEPGSADPPPPADPNDIQDPDPDPPVDPGLPVPTGPPPSAPVPGGDPDSGVNPDVDWGGRPWLDPRVQDCIREYLEIVLSVANERRRWENTGRAPTNPLPLFTEIDDWGRLLNQYITTGGRGVDGNWDNPSHFVWSQYNDARAESLYGRTVEYYVRYECNSLRPPPGTDLVTGDPSIPGGTAGARLIRDLQVTSDSGTGDPFYGEGMIASATVDTRSDDTPLAVEWQRLSDGAGRGELQMLPLGTPDPIVIRKKFDPLPPNLRVTYDTIVLTVTDGADVSERRTVDVTWRKGDAFKHFVFRKKGGSKIGSRFAVGETVSVSSSFRIGEELGGERTIVYYADGQEFARDDVRVSGNTTLRHRADLALAGHRKGSVEIVAKLLTADQAVCGTGSGRILLREGTDALVLAWAAKSKGGSSEKWFTTGDSIVINARIDAAAGRDGERSLVARLKNERFETSFPVSGGETVSEAVALDGADLKPGRHFVTLHLLDENGRKQDRQIVRFKVEKEKKPATTVGGLQDIVCDGDRVTIKIWDHASQDGDIISLKVGDNWVRTDFNLDACGGPDEPIDGPGVFLNLPLPKGTRVPITIYAHNEGSSSPNTAALKVDGACTPALQHWSLKTDESATVWIIRN